MFSKYLHKIETKKIKFTEKICNYRTKNKVPIPKTVSDIQLHHGKARQDLFSWMESLSDQVNNKERNIFA